MYPARSGEDVDARSSTVCSRCSRPASKPIRRVLIMVLAYGIIIMCLDSVAFAIQPKRTPFSFSQLEGKAAVLYKKHPVVLLQDTPGAPATARAHALTLSLNTLFLQLNPATFVVRSESLGRASIQVGDMTLAEFTAADAGGHDPSEFAREWLKNIEPILRSKGTESESCRDCHGKRR